MVGRLENEGETMDATKLPTGWRIADDVAMAKLRWAAHVFETVRPSIASVELDSYKRALADLRSALYSINSVTPNV